MSIASTLSLSCPFSHFFLLPLPRSFSSSLFLSFSLPLHRKWTPQQSNPAKPQQQQQQQPQEAPDTARVTRLARFGDNASRARSKSRDPQRAERARSKSRGRAPKGQLLEDMADARTTARPTTQQGAKQQRAQELLEAAKRMEKEHEYARAGRAYEEAERLLAEANDRPGAEAASLKRQHAESMVKMKAAEGGASTARAQELMREAVAELHKAKWDTAVGFVLAHRSFPIFSLVPPPYSLADIHSFYLLWSPVPSCLSL